MNRDSHKADQRSASDPTPPEIPPASGLPAPVLPPGTDESALITKACDGDQAALTMLLERCGPQVRLRMAGKIAQTWQAVLDLDDVMQVTYLEAFLQVEKFKPKGLGAFAGWLSQIAENNLRDAIRGLERAKRPNPRNQVRAKAGPVADSYIALVELLGVTDTTPSRVAARGELKAILDQTLCELPPDYEQVIRLVDLEGKPINEVCTEMKRTAGAVHMLRARAHDRLKGLLGSPSKFLSNAS